jgi:hypothetical protein
MSIPRLDDWIVMRTCVRGSVAGDGGNWVSASAPPVAFDPVTRIATTANGKRYELPLRGACKALKLHLRSEEVLASLVP